MPKPRDLYLEQFPKEWGAFRPRAITPAPENEPMVLDCTGPACVVVSRPQELEPPTPLPPPEPQPIQRKRKRRHLSEAFLRSPEWKALREEAFRLFGRICHRCGSTSQIQCDHIKPRKRYPALALCLDNLQVLCWPCNRHKNFRDETRYRPETDRERLGNG
jgi:hypothetical protein